MFRRSNVLAWVAAATALGLSVAQTAHAAGDPVAGQKKFYTCYGCHGVETTRTRIPTTACPSCVIRTRRIIISALHEYKSGQRPHPTMHAQASSLSDQDIEDIAAYLQGPEPVKPPAPTGTPPQQATACVACHGVNGLGVACTARSEAADTRRTARRLPRRSAQVLSQQAPQERGHERHGAAPRHGRGHPDRRRILRAPALASQDGDDGKQVAAAAPG